MPVKHIICLLCIMCILSGCMVNTPSQETPNESVSVYYITDWATNYEADQVISACVFTPDSDDKIAFCIEQLLLPPLPDNGLLSPFPSGTGQVSPYTLADGLLTLYLSDEYTSLQGIDLTMAEACLALTLCPLPNVTSVRVSVNGEPYHAQGKTRCTATDFSLDALVLKPVDKSLTLYFVDADTGVLVSEVRLVTIRENEPTERYVLEELLNGPKSTDLSTALPGDAFLLGVSTENNICYVNFSPSFYDESPPFTHVHAIQAITRSLTSLPGIDAVQFLRDGQVAESYGDMQLEQPIS